MSVALPLTKEAVPGPCAGPLTDRVILVVGAAGGLGCATSMAAARAGATVVLLGRKVRALEQLYDAICHEALAQPAIFPLDLEGATADDYAALADAIAGECGRLDGIVHAAARFDGLTPLAHVAPDAFMRTLHSNLAAPWLLTRACLPLLQHQSDAAVIFVLDDPAEVAKPYRGAYGVAKSALPALVAMLHAETDRTSLRIHGIRPGPMATRLRARAYFAEDAGQLSGPVACADAVVRLLGDGASPWRGKTVDVADIGNAS
ncbi:MAG: SDR family NAD(P)-dependent oxidoreductase [Lysobacterales bacterium]